MDYFKKATSTTPAIIMDSSSKSVLIKGVSICPDISTCTSFADDILDNLNKSTYTDLNIQLKLFNPFTAKSLIALFKSIKKGKPSLMIHWLYEKQDEEMREMGQDYSELLEMEFNISSN